MCQSEKHKRADAHSQFHLADASTYLRRRQDGSINLNVADSGSESRRRCKTPSQKLRDVSASVPGCSRSANLRERIAGVSELWPTHRYAVGRDQQAVSVLPRGIPGGQADGE
jgi:hypothetical protein